MTTKLFLKNSQLEAHEKESSIISEAERSINRLPSVAESTGLGISPPLYQHSRKWKKLDPLELGLNKSEDSENMDEGLNVKKTKKKRKKKTKKRTFKTSKNEIDEKDFEDSSDNSVEKDIPEEDSLQRKISKISKRAYKKAKKRFSHTNINFYTDPQKNEKNSQKQQLENSKDEKTNSSRKKKSSKKKKNKKKKFEETIKTGDPLSIKTSSIKYLKRGKIE